MPQFDSISSTTPGNRFPHLFYILKVYILGMAIFTLFRAMLLISEWPRLRGIPGVVLGKALIMGIRFDTVVSAYILFIPFLIATLLGFCAPRSAASRKILSWLILALYAFAISLCAADIPYVRLFNTRLTFTITTWVDDVSIFLSAILKNPFFLLFLILALFSIVLFALILFRATRTWIEQRQDRPSPTLAIAITLASIMLLLLGVRGRISIKSPIRWGTSFFSNHAFANQVGLNPVFTFVSSYLENRRNRPLMDRETAIRLVRRWYGAPPGSPSPVSRQVPGSPLAQKQNIVLIIMESMGMDLLGRSDFHSPTITPFLDDLSQRSLLFDRFYSGGIHTYSAIWELFAGLPSLPEARSPLKDSRSMTPFSGMATLLSKEGYATLFACPHDEQFDNLGGFLRINGFQTILSTKNFPGIKLSPPWNIPDHQFFDLLLPHLRQTAAGTTPFLFVILTVSNHPPYALPSPLPPGFHPHSGEKWQQVVEYADWALGGFFRKVQEEPWFDNTLFVLVADHGLNLHPRYEVNPEAHHIPLILHAPRLISQPGVLSPLGTQVDLMPTVMHLLGISYTNRTFGRDLFLQGHSNLLLFTDQRLGILNEDFLLVDGESGQSFLYDLNRDDSINRLAFHTQQAREMKTYAYALLQTAKEMMENRSARTPLP